MSIITQARSRPGYSISVLCDISTNLAVRVSTESLTVVRSGLSLRRVTLGNVSRYPSHDDNGKIRVTLCKLSMFACR